MQSLSPILAVSAALFLSGCSSSDSDRSTSTTSPTRYEGIWIAEAYGEALQITRNGTDFRGPKYTQANTLPPSCIQPATDSDAVQEFSWFSQLFEEYYPSFDQRGIDWATLTQAAGSELHIDSDATDLIEAMVESIEPLADSHVALLIGDQEIGFIREDSVKEQRFVEEFITTNGLPETEEDYQDL